MARVDVCDLIAESGISEAMSKLLAGITSRYGKESISKGIDIGFSFSAHDVREEDPVAGLLGVYSGRIRLDKVRPYSPEEERHIEFMISEDSKKKN